MNHPSAAPHPASRPAKHSSEEASRSSAATRTQHLSLTPLLAGGSSVAAASSSWRTRSLYATARYVGKFIWWRIVRYGKYLALGAVTATLGGTFLGTLVSGASIFVAPTAAMGFVIAGGLAVAKFGWRHRPSSIRHLESRVLDTLRFSPAARQPTTPEQVAGTASRRKMAVPVEA